MSKYRMLRQEEGFCRVLYRGPKNTVYALADDGGWGRRNLVWYVCTRDGEPSYARPMPPQKDFVEYVEP